jgi:hypothetical protein
LLAGWLALFDCHDARDCGQTCEWLGNLTKPKLNLRHGFDQTEPNWPTEICIYSQTKLNQKLFPPKQKPISHLIVVIFIFTTFCISSLFLDSYSAILIKLSAIIVRVVMNLTP